MNDEVKWLIWSHEHTKWWAANWRGYVTRRAEAGRYSFEEACKIVREANIRKQESPNEAMVRDEPIQ